MRKAFKVIIRWIITLLLISVFAFLIWLLLINRKEVKYTEPLSPVKLEKPFISSLDQSFTLSGYVQASAMIPVVPFVSGTIKEYKVNAGDFVEEGQLLAVVDPEPYKLQMDQAEAVYLAAKATYERVDNLFKVNAATRQNYDEAKAQYDAYKAQYELAKVQLGYTEITAPVSGTILMENSAVGSVASPQSYIYIIADLDKLEVTLNVPEQYFDIINDNLKDIKAEVSREGITSNAVIKSVSPYISPESKTFQISLSITSNVEKFRPGMFVKVNLTYKTYSNVYLLKRSVINTDGSIYYYSPSSSTVVFLDYSPDISNDSYFAVPEEYSDTLFVTEGQSNLLDGKKVRVI